MLCSDVLDAAGRDDDADEDEERLDGHGGRMEGQRCEKERHGV